MADGLDLNQGGNKETPGTLRSWGAYWSWRRDVKPAALRGEAAPRGPPGNRLGTSYSPDPSVSSPIALPKIKNRGFPQRGPSVSLMERAMGLEPTTSSLGSWHSTTELRPPFHAAQEAPPQPRWSFWIDCSFAFALLMLLVALMLEGSIFRHSCHFVMASSIFPLMYRFTPS